MTPPLYFHLQTTHFVRWGITFSILLPEVFQLQYTVNTVKMLVEIVSAECFILFYGSDATEGWQILNITVFKEREMKLSCLGRGDWLEWSGSEKLLSKEILLAFSDATWVLFRRNPAENHMEDWTPLQLFQVSPIKSNKCWFCNPAGADLPHTFRKLFHICYCSTEINHIIFFSSRVKMHHGWATPSYTLLSIYSDAE